MQCKMLLVASEKRYTRWLAESLKRRLSWNHWDFETWEAQSFKTLIPWMAVN